ncbi:MAG: MobF family relaxase [Mycobacterium sp.]
MTIHKLTAGDGYTYLIRQVAASDSTHRGRPSLDDYYSSKGETPGRWMGAGLASLGQPAGRDPSDPAVQKYWSVAEGSDVSEAQMKALFGEGLHPNAEKIGESLIHLGASVATVAARLGRPFPIHEDNNELLRRLRGAYFAYNLAFGRDAYDRINDDVRADIRSAVGREMFVEMYGREPSDAREFSGFTARESRPATTAVAGYDLTFTPVKSVSVAWALAPRTLARQLERAHRLAVKRGIAVLEEHAAFSRMGAGGVAQVESTGLIIAAFDHRDSRSGDPNLHTHIVVSNKVCVIGADGIPRWLALDGKALYQMNVAASEAYNTALEGYLIELGFRFAPTDRGVGKRCVREIAGIPAELVARFSRRRNAIENRVGELAKAFQNQHGREPTATEYIALAQQANLETRAAKHEPTSLGEQRQMWRTQAAEVVGGVREVDAMIAAVSSNRAAESIRLDQKSVDRLAVKVIETVSASRSTWRPHHVRAEAERQLRYANRAGDRQAVERIVAAALEGHSAVVSRQTDSEMGEPAVLRRSDGSSVYRRHGETVYSSAAVLAAERRILAAAGRSDGAVADEVSIDLALLAADANGRSLNDGQRTLVREMAASGARVQLALAPAGTGKTTAMAALAAAWRNSGGTVVGFAPTAAAAEVLAADLGAATDTIAKLVALAGPDASSQAVGDDPARAWFDGIDTGTLVVVDEAGKASTAELDAVIALALARGASVRLVGDDHQLASVSAGGVLRDLASGHRALTLSEVVRFGDTERGKAEGAASLALRGGDPAGIAFYLDHRRIHVGADALAADQAYTAWLNDQRAGRNSVLLAPTNALVAELNDRARADRLRTRGEETGATVELGDGLLASAGDWITTRSNARWLRTGECAWVKNGQRWIIRAVEQDGSLTVSALGGDDAAARVRLPARYVRDHTTLGYASTIDISQGITADTCHVVASDQLNRQQLYVALTRGRQENHLYFSTAESDPHRILAPKATFPPTAVDILTAILRRDSAQQSAHSVMRASGDPALRLGPASAMYLDALGAAAENCAGAETMARIDSAATQLNSALSECEAWPVLRRHLALLALEGEDPVAVLDEAMADGGLDDARDPAAILDWRLPMPAAKGVGPLHWLDPIPNALMADSQWNAYLSARAGLVADLASQVRDSALQWTTATVPVWARPLMDTKPRLLAEIAVFRASHGVESTDIRITGPEQYRRRSSIAQNGLRLGVNELLPQTDPATRRWRRQVETLDRRLTEDWFWPQLATHIDDAARAGADVERLLRQAMESGGPLPDELPAAALWWRLAGSPAPATAKATVDVDVPQTAQSETVSETWTLDRVFANEKPDRHELMTEQRSIDRYDLENDLDQLRAEVSVLEAAGSRSPATCYRPDLVQVPDPSKKRIAAAIADSDMSIQPLRCNTAVETHAVLKSLAVAAAKSGRSVLALPATNAAAARADQDRYSHRTHSPEDGILKFQSGEWRPPVGALIIVDDADHLTEIQLKWLMANAGATNTQVVLATSEDTTRGPARYLVDVLAENLPWSSDRDRSAGIRTTAVSRTTAHLNRIEQLETDPERAAANLLAQLDERVNRLRELAAPLRVRSRGVSQPGRDIGLGL